MIASSSSADLPCSSSSSSAFPCCSSSSSDETEADTRGWPSVVNVLETPDRRRMRKTCRSVAIRLDLNKISASVRHFSSVTNIHRPLPAIISRRYFSTFSPNKRKTDLKKLTTISSDYSPNNGKAAETHFSSPPLMGRMRRSPVLRTPKAHNCSQPKHIHLSVSPMSAFFIRQRLSAQGDPCGDSPPKCASAASLSVLRPLNVQQNHFGIRFSGEQPKEMTRLQLNETNFKSGERKSKVPSSSAATDENAFVVPKRNAQTRAPSEPTKGNCCADDSGFLDCSALSSASVVETPSKGLSSFGASPSTSSACLFLDFDHSQHSHRGVHPTSSSSFYSTTSSVHEQSYGPLEASILDGILNDISRWPSSDGKTPGKMRLNSQHRSLLFERKLKALEIGGTETISTDKVWGEPPDAVTTRGIPSEVVLEMEGMAGEVPFEELRLLLPHLDHHSSQLLFGLSSDQLELTSSAYSFIHFHCSRRANTPPAESSDDCVTREQLRQD
ncbi:hypothetical protein niasHS_002525 [Heterodera schachtii]|uniref:Uncharacterized protein n=1 Tax=Heterodera schachtii TaxID=97005 RepID=A0ABD2KKP4_HETSC